MANEAVTAAATLAIVEEIRPLLAGKSPAVQGAVVAELAALWLAGHDERLREVMFADLCALVRNLTPINAAIIRGER